MTITVNVHEAKTQLSRLLERVMNGEQVVIAKSGRPVAVLTPFVKAPEARQPGKDAGKVLIAPDFDAPLLEFEKP